ncbi:MAG: CPBP family intramembrane glutamic endopeptidase [Bacteroidota bacterium]
MKKHLTLAWIAMLLAVAITTTMDFLGYVMFSAFPLIVLTIAFWIIARLSRTEIGLRWGRGKYYRWALAYPLVVLGITALIAFVTGDFSIATTNNRNEIINLVAGLVIGPIGVLITEEGFFRGVLWGLFGRARYSATKTLYVTTAAFVVWHVSAVLAESEFGLPLSQIPIYLVNATLMGLIWGSLRMASGSIIVASVCHAIWNALAYGLFGYGEKVGLLGVSQTWLLGPEVGLLGILLNGLFYLWLRRQIAREGTN